MNNKKMYRIMYRIMFSGYYIPDSICFDEYNVFNLIYKPCTYIVMDKHVLIDPITLRAYNRIYFNGSR